MLRAEWTVLHQIGDDRTYIGIMASDVYLRLLLEDQRYHFSFFCKSLPVSYLIDEIQLIFFNKLQHTDSPILRTLFHLPTVKYKILGLAAKYGLNGVQGNVSAMKDCVWTCCVQKVRF